MSKQIQFTTKDVLTGLNISCDAIKQTIGPRGRNGFIDHEMSPLITNDGKSIASAITLKDFENMGCWLVKNTCDKTFEDVGDATTTTAILLQAIIKESLARPENPVKIKQSLKEIGLKVERWIDEETHKIKDSQIKDVATVAGEAEYIGNIIAEIIERVGKKTPIYIEENHYGTGIESVTVEGLETKNGYISSPNPIVERDNAVVFVTDKRIDSLMQIDPLMKILEDSKITTPVFIIPDIEEAAYKFFMKLNEMGAFNILVIRAKGTDLHDMASACGATIISTKTGLDFKDILPSHLGVAKKLIVSQYKSVIVSHDNPLKQKAIEDLRIQSASTTNTYEKQMYDRRAEALAGGIVMIKVGGHTDSERGYLKLKMLNAVNTTKTALEHGVVPGAGLCLYRIANKIKGNSPGEEILKKALKEPLRNIIENAGEDYASITRKMGSKKGYDAVENKVVDMMKAGIIDSAKSTKSAFTNALSSAAEFITVGVVITNETNK